jgi:hypothetical protein
MTPTGPTEEDRHYMADTGADAADMKTQVDAYRATMTALVKKVLPMGGFWWQLMDNTGNRLAGHNATVAQCKQVLADVCKPTPEFWNRMGMYVINGGGPAHQGLSEADLTQFTAEFCALPCPLRACSFARSLVRSFARSLVRTRSLVRSFARSLFLVADYTTGLVFCDAALQCSLVVHTP